MEDRLTGEEPEQTESKSYADILDEAFPHYLAMGMTAEEYWDGEYGLKRAFRKAFRIRLENEERIADRNMWLMGAYIRDAMQSMYVMVNGFVPKGVRATPYPDKPRLETYAEVQKAEAKKKAEENKQKMAMAMFHAMAERFNKNFKRRQEPGSGKGATT